MFQLPKSFWVLPTCLIVGSLCGSCGALIGSVLTSTQPDRSAQKPDSSTQSPSSPSQSPSSPSQSPSNGYQYPQAAIDTFVKACAEAGTQKGTSAEVMQKSCTCIINKLQKRYTYEQLKKINADVTAGKSTPPEFNDISISCARQYIN